MKYYLYILLTSSNTLYTGIAKDIFKRFDEHKNDPKKGAKYTKANKPLEILYVDIFEDKSSASKEEYRIKHSLSRQQKLEMIEKNKKRTTQLLATARRNS